MADSGSFNADLGINMQFNIDGAGLVEMTKTIKEISKGKDLQRYWKDVESATDSAAKAIERYNKNTQSKGLAENFLKEINALKAITNKENMADIFPNMNINFDKLIESAKKIAPQINSEFSTNNFSQAFKTFNLLKDKGIELGEVFQNLADYAKKVDENFELRRENNELKELFTNQDIEKAKSNLAEIQKLRNEAEDTFNNFLNVNKIERIDFWGDEKFSEYFTEIRNGSLTATEAIAKFKTEYAYLLEESFKSNNNMFGLDQLQVFSTKLDSIFHQVEETSNKINDIISNGVIAKSVQNLSSDISLSDSQRSIFGNLLKDEESLKSITTLFQKLIEESNKTRNTEVFNTEQFSRIESLFASIESSLASIKSVLVDVGDGEELSPLLKMIDNINVSIKNLSSSVKNIGLNMNIDVSSNSELETKIQTKMSNALQAYQRLFEHIKMSSVGGSAITDKFFQFDINQFDSMMAKIQAYRKFIENTRNEAKTFFNGNDILYSDTEKKYWTQAASAMGQLTKAQNELNRSNDTSPLDNLFGTPTDLSSVIEQLNSIIAKLDEISLSANRFASIFKEGLNVNASIEEINKLTNRVKELESELEKVRTLSSTPQIESNISSGLKDAIQVDGSEVAATQKIADNFKEAKQNTDKATEAAKDYIRVLSQVGELGVDSKVSAMYERNDGQLESVSWRAKRDEQGQILYDKNGDIDYDISSTVISKYEQLEKIITTADNKVRDLEKSLKDVQNLNPNASTKNIEDQIQYQKDYIKLLEQTVKAISQQDEYLLYEQQIIDARAKAKKEYNLNQGTRSDISNAKQLASEEQKRQKNIEQTNRLLNRQQITIDTIEKSYNKIANPDLDKSVSDTSDLSELSKKKSEIQNLINQLNGQSRNSSNEQEFLQLEKLISEYKQLAKDKLKANNPSKQELGGQDLTVLLEQQVAQYNQLIAKAEKYGDATSDIVDKLKTQRDLIAQANSDGVYTAKSGLKADDYYSARDNYKIGKAQFSSYETDIKNTEKLIQAQKELGEATTKARQAAKDSTQSSVDNALKEQVSAWKNIQSIREKIAKTKDTDEIANLQKIKKEYQQNYIEADKILKANSSLYDKEIQVAKLEQIRVETNKKIADYNDKQVSGFDKRISGYEDKLTNYQATAKKFEGGGWTSDTYKEQIEKLNNAIREYKSLLDSMQHDSGFVTDDNIEQLNEYESKIKEVISTVSNMSAAEKGFSFLSAQKELDKINNILKEHSGMSREAKNQIRAYYAQIKSGNPSASLDVIHAKIMEIVNAEIEAGRGGKSMFDAIKEKAWYGVAGAIGTYFGFNDILSYAKEGIQVVREFDTALTEMKKVSDETTQSLKNYQATTFDTADAVGTTALQIQNSTADYMRLGESLEEASESAKTANILLNVSEFDNIEDATKSLVSMGQAYKDLDKLTIVDKLNEVGRRLLPKHTVMYGIFNMLLLGKSVKSQGWLRPRFLI